MLKAPAFTVAAVAASLLAAGFPAGPAQGAPSPGEPESPALHVARQTLAAGDGWGAVGAGTTGGAAASGGDVFVVDSRAELAEAVSGDRPKIVVVSGVIDANTDDAGNELECSDYHRDGYTLERYLETYDPEVWGREAVPSGPVEDARAASQQAQEQQIGLRIGSNTTLVGEPGAAITGAALQILGESNVIIRGLTVSDAHDCFPAWDPTDGSSGAWNSEYDLVTLRGATNVWVDHNDLSDGDNPDSAQPRYFGKPYQVHDGLLDITEASDLVTVSYNRLHDHDKTMLIGSSDSRTGDAGKLRVTLHHNEFRNLGQRVPRLRYGKLDVYNNHYVQDPGKAHSYSWGVGWESHIVAERNALTFADHVRLDKVIGHFKGTKITENDNTVNGEVTDLLAAYNAARDPDIAEVPAFATIRRTVHPTTSVARVVTQLAGPEKLGARERITVAADGSGDADSIQGAVDLAPANPVDRVDVVIEPGTYHGRVDIDRNHSKLSFIGATRDPADVVITDNRASGTPKPGGGTWGTTGSASVTVAGNEFEAYAVTFENAFDEAAHPEITNRQAVAVKTTADRVVFRKVRFLGNQDTLYLDSPSADVRSRVLVADSWIEGDVDFIFGRASAVITDSTIKALRRDSDPNGYVTAPSTSRSNPYGFLITKSRLISNAQPGSYFLGRPWHPSSAPDNDPRVVIRESSLGNHIKTEDPWTSMSGYDWYPGSNAEYRNSGPGASVNPNRPQLTPTEAADHEVGDYLAGYDGWAPHLD